MHVCQSFPPFEMFLQRLSRWCARAEPTKCRVLHHRRTSGDGLGPSTPAWVAHRQAAGASATPAQPGKLGDPAKSSNLGATDKQPAPAAAQPPRNAAADSALADGDAGPSEPAADPPPQTQAKQPEVPGQAPGEAEQLVAAANAEVPDGLEEASVTDAQPKDVAAAAEEPPAASTDSILAQVDASAGEGYMIAPTPGTAHSSSEKDEAASLPEAAGLADSGKPQSEKGLSISPAADSEAGSDVPNGNLPSPAQDGGIIPSTMLPNSTLGIRVKLGIACVLPALFKASAKLNW